MNIDNDLQITLEITKPNYRRYKLYKENICGRIVLECYNDIWHLELMDVRPTGQGYGTIFLSKVLTTENLKADNMTVCPISSNAACFFKRNGFKISDDHINRLDNMLIG